MTTIGVFGLGAMGGGMARSCLRAGLTVHGFDLDAEREAALRGDGGAVGGFEDVVEALDVVATVVVNADQTEALLFGGNGIAGALKPGTVILSSATMAPTRAKALAERAAELGLIYLDCPVSGGPARAAAGDLAMLVAGPDAGVAKAQPALDAMARIVFRVGTEIGQASAMKAVNQILTGVSMAAAAEAVAFAMTQGIAPEQTLEVISKCAGTSWAFEFLADHVARGDYAPLSAVDIWPKDLGIAMDIARDASFSAPMTSAALQQFIAAAGAGLGKEDAAALTKIYARNAGLTLPEAK